MEQDRREFLKKSAIVGGAAWAAPAIATVGAAVASPSSPPSCVCASCTAVAAGVYATGPLSIPRTCGPTVTAGPLGGVTVSATVLGCSTGNCTAGAKVASATLVFQSGILKDTVVVSTLCTCASQDGCCSNKGNTTIASVTVNGAGLNLSVPCNSGIFLDGLISITLNEQKCASGVFTVTGLHIASTLLGENIFLAQSQVKCSSCAACPAGTNGLSGATPCQPTCSTGC